MERLIRKIASNGRLDFCPDHFAEAVEIVAGLPVRDTGPMSIDERLLTNLERLRSWCIHQDPNATIWLHIDEAIRALKDAERQRRIAIEWANKSVDSIKEAMWEAQDALRARTGSEDRA